MDIDMQKKNIWLFGAGDIARKFMNDVNQRQKIEKVKGIIDNAHRKNGQQIEGKMVYFYDEISYQIDKSSDKIIITCRKAYAEEIVLQLVRNGFQELIEGIYLGGGILSYESMYSLEVNSQYGEELGLRNIFAKAGLDYKGFYVDVGAYHPFRLSNTKWAYDRGWRGINIDPNEENIVLFEAFRPEDINLHCGVSDENGMLPFYKYTNNVCNSFDDTLQRNLKLEKVVYVPVRTLNDILSEYNIQHIDILDIDAEGFDEKIIQSFDWERYKPVCVLVEVLSEEKPHFWTSDIHKTLTSYGYQFTSLFVKTLVYVHQEWLV